MTHKLLTIKRLGMMAFATVVIATVVFGYLLEQGNPIEPTTNTTIESATNTTIESATNTAIESATNTAIESTTNSTTDSATNSTIETATYSAIESVTSDPTILSPLSNLLGIELNNESNFENNERMAQVSIEECMAGKGFEYTPMNQVPSPKARRTDSTDEGSLAYVNTHGYGITDSLEQEIESFVNGESFFIDPNEKVRASLSASDAEAYDVALTGFSTNQIEWRESDGAPVNSSTGQVLSKSEFANLSEGGCLQKAYAPENEHHTHLVSELLVGDDYHNVQLQILNDSRMIDLQVDWSRCMAAKGYDYSSPQRLRDNLYTQGRNIVEKQADSNNKLSNSDITKLLASHRLDELELAAADWDCSDDFIQSAPFIAREHELNFIEENEELILDILHAKNL